MTDNRPSKKQQELLSFIDGFIKGNGYGPSYREIMRSLGYKSVSTVAAHVDALVAKGFLKKGDDYSARSIEVMHHENKRQDQTHLEWLKLQEKQLREAEQPEKADILKQAIDLLDQSDPKTL